MKLKFIDKQKKGFRRYCPTFARCYDTMREGIGKRKIKRQMKKLRH
jgi:hypothetical protein